MFTIPGVRKFHEWTHASLTALLDHLSTIPDTAYAQEVPGFGFPTIRAQVIHILNCEGFWIHTLQAIPFDDEPAASWPTVSDARRLQSEVSTTTLDYLSRLSEQNLNAPTELHFPDGDVAVRTPRSSSITSSLMPSITKARLSRCAVYWAIPRPTPI